MAESWVLREGLPLEMAMEACSTVKQTNEDLQGYYLFYLDGQQDGSTRRTMESADGRDVPAVGCSAQDRQDRQRGAHRLPAYGRQAIPPAAGDKETIRGMTISNYASAAQRQANARGRIRQSANPGGAVVSLARVG